MQFNELLLRLRYGDMMKPTPLSIHEQESAQALLVELDQIRRDNINLRNHINALEEKLSTLEILADTDPLTQLPNRRCFSRELDRIIRHVSRYKTHTAVLYVDVDGLKTVNDEHGHLAGDFLLCEIAKRLRQAMRSTDHVARIGGDEFGLIVDPIEPEAISKKISNLTDMIRKQAAVYQDITINMHASIGYTFVQVEDSEEDIMRRADVAMYNIKRRLAVS